MSPNSCVSKRNPTLHILARTQMKFPRLSKCSKVQSVLEHMLEYDPAKRAVLSDFAGAVP